MGKSCFQKNGQKLGKNKAKKRAVVLLMLFLDSNWMNHPGASKHK